MRTTDGLCSAPDSASLRGGPFPWEPSRGPYQDVGGRSRSTDAPVLGTAGIPLPPCSEGLEKELLERDCGQRGVREPNGMRESGSREKTASVACQPNIVASCSASLGRREGGTVVPSKRVPRSPCEPDFPGCLKGKRARPGGHEENWFLRKKYGTCWWGLTPGF